MLKMGFLRLAQNCDALAKDYIYSLIDREVYCVKRGVYYFTARYHEASIVDRGFDVRPLIRSTVKSLI